MARSWYRHSQASWRSPIAGTAITSVCLALALAETIVVATPAQAQQQRFDLDIPTGTLAASLTALSTATGISIGYAGALPPIRVARVHGHLTPEEALRRLLGDSGLTVRAIGATIFRIERAPQHLSERVQKPSRKALVASGLPAPPRPSPPASSSGEIIVTGQKRPQILGEVPMSLSVIAPGDMTGGIGRGSRDLALSVEGLALTNLGPGRNRQFIRGVADSPFIGPSQSTVSVLLDDARLTFDAPDPDLRPIDIERIEILKGPQGPLYGSGAIGGIYHIVTRKPELDRPSASMRLLGETVTHGTAGIGGEVVLNVPIVENRLAIRAVAYTSSQSGWIDNIGRNNHANTAETKGGRVALRWQPSPDWTIDLGAVAQYLNVADSQYVTASADTLRRNAAIAEPSFNDFQSFSGTITGQIGALKLISATSYIDHTIDFTLDASASAAAFGTAAPTVYRDDQSYTILNQELRVSPIDGGHWLAGASFLQASSHSNATIGNIDGTPRFSVETLDRTVTEYALFGEGTLSLTRRLNATAGLRLFHTVAEDKALERAGTTLDSVGKTALSPSLALSWSPNSNTLAYLRYARALRPGGLAPNEGMQATRFDADELGTIDLGVRHQPVNGRLIYSASLFHTLWSDVQSDYLLANGLVATRNAGQAQILGLEASGAWSALRRTRISGGISVQDARLTHTEAGIKIDDRRLPVAPAFSGRIEVRQDFSLGAWQSSIVAQANYIGRARLSLDTDIDRSMGNYATTSTAISFNRGTTTLALRLDNMFDVRGDSFAFGNPFSIRTSRQYTPLRPRTLTISIGRSW